MLAAFQDIVLPGARIDFCTSGNGELILKENAKDSKIKKLSILNVPEQSFAFTLDFQPKKKAMSPLIVENFPRRH